MADQVTINMGDEVRNLMPIVPRYSAFISTYAANSSYRWPKRPATAKDATCALECLNILKNILKTSLKHP